ncbi:hypothetical protein DL240_14240 [Lujinxingia litoralis]|uniref:Uncharacterized protein n=1 Tax=Lujinxingia litoralis TaxID=2211119 RepID=A0A328C598_9DELT|nr:hypothetical protein DL240_14240 [Lujinxingia litoralis]
MGLRALIVALTLLLSAPARSQMLISPEDDPDAWDESEKLFGQRTDDDEGDVGDEDLEDLEELDGGMDADTSPPSPDAAPPTPSAPPAQGGGPPGESPAERGSGLNGAATPSSDASVAGCQSGGAQGSPWAISVVLIGFMLLHAAGLLGRRRHR